MCIETFLGIMYLSLLFFLNFWFFFLVKNSGKQLAFFGKLQRVKKKNYKYSEIYLSFFYFYNKFKEKKKNSFFSIGKVEKFFDSLSLDILIGESLQLKEVISEYYLSLIKKIYSTSKK